MIIVASNAVGHLSYSILSQSRCVILPVALVHLLCDYEHCNFTWLFECVLQSNLFPLLNELGQHSMRLQGKQYIINAQFTLPHQCPLLAISRCTSFVILDLVMHCTIDMQPVVEQQKKVVLLLLMKLMNDLMLAWRQRL